MSDIQNLWPNNFGNVNIVFPKEVLVKQARYLTEMTKNLLVAEVVSHQGNMAKTNENVIVHELIITAPAMGNYQFTLLRLIHNLGIYPLRVYDALMDTSTNVENEEELLGTLSAIFTTKKTQNAINSMIIQSRS